MVKIEIDDVIRGYALIYMQQVNATCNDVEKKLITLGSYVANHNAWGDKKAVMDYINLLVADYPKVLTLEPIEWKTYIDKYNKVLKREPDMLTTEVVYGMRKNNVLKGKFYERIVKCLQYDKARMIIGNIHQQMGLKTCVYCNVNSTLANDGDVLYQMDHYMPQSLYPFLGTCFYNLQPSCGICNGHKGTQSCDFGLYVNRDQHKELNPFRFMSKINSIDGAYPVCEDIFLNGKDKCETKESKAHDEMFHIHNMYAGYKDKVSNLYANGYKLNESVVKIMSAAFGIKSRKEDVLAYISDETSLNGKDIHKEPLTKLKQDTIKQMQEGGVL